MGKNYDLIAQVGIELNSPISDNGSLEHLLIVGPLPAGLGENDTPPADFGAYASIDEVSAAGWSISGASVDPVGAAAVVAFSQNPKPSKIYIAPTKVIGNTVEDAAVTVARASGYDGWYIVCPAGIPKAQYAGIAAYIETKEKMFCYTELDFFKTNPGASTVSGKFRTVAIYARETSNQIDANIPAANNYANVAFAAKWLGYDSGSETTAFKQLAGITPSTLTEAEIEALKAANVNIFMTVGNRNITIGGKVVGNEWADIIRFRDWLKNDMQTRMVNLFATRAKIPFTDAGIALIQNQMIASLKAGQDAGGIAEDEFTEDGQLVPGFTTTVPTSASVSSAEKQSRDLSGCTFTARLAGAIHFAEISGYLSYEI